MGEGEGDEREDVVVALDEESDCAEIDASVEERCGKVIELL